MKKGIIGIGLLLFIAGCYFFPYRTDIYSVKYSPVRMQNDFDIFREVLENAHPGLYTYTDKQEMDRCFDSVYQTLNEQIDIRAFHEKLSFVAAKIGCSHTNLYLPKAYYDTMVQRANFFPVPLVYVDGGLYVNSDMWDIPVGAHILSINGNSAENIMKKIAVYNVPDGRNKSYSLSAAAIDFSYDYFLSFGASENFVVEYASPKSVGKEVGRVAATTLEKHLSQYNQYAYYFFPDEVGYDFEVVDSLHTAILTLRSFSYSTATTFAAYKNFITNSFALLQKDKDITNLVIDVRNNTGGEYENIFLLMRFLSKTPFREVDSATVTFEKTPFTRYLEKDFADTEKPALDSMIKHEFCKAADGKNIMTEEENTLHRPHPSAFDGNLFVVTNSNVLSAASNFVAVIKDTKRGKIIGDETGGGYNGHNGFTRVLYKLPNTQLQLEFSVIRVQHYLQHKQLNKNGVQPDFPVATGIEDVIDNQDPQMAFVMGQLISRD
ncbi:MAG: hypothetical protein H7Y27_15140 [Gemmatimonadaceae bacterium]|nr:hypothetical protein [Chitinophagaceae bacterium]